MWRSSKTTAKSSRELPAGSSWRTAASESLAEKMIIEGGWREDDSPKEPAVWFHALPLNIRGTYLWARMVTYPHFKPIRQADGSEELLALP